MIDRIAQPAAPPVHLAEAADGEASSEFTSLVDALLSGMSGAVSVGSVDGETGGSSDGDADPAEGGDDTADPTPVAPPATTLELIRSVHRLVTPGATATIARPDGGGTGPIRIDATPLPTSTSGIGGRDPQATAGPTDDLMETVPAITGTIPDAPSTAPTTGATTDSGTTPDGPIPNSNGRVTPAPGRTDHAVAGGRSDGLGWGRVDASPDDPGAQRLPAMSGRTPHSASGSDQEDATPGHGATHAGRSTPEVTGASPSTRQPATDPAQTTPDTPEVDPTTLASRATTAERASDASDERPAPDEQAARLDPSPTADVAAPPSRIHTAEHRTDASPRLVDRVEEAVRRLENAPPPRSVTIDMDDTGSARLTITLRHNGLELRSNTGDARLVADIERALAGRGFDMADQRGRRDPGPDDRDDGWRPPPAPSQTTDRRSPSAGGLRL